MRMFAFIGPPRKKQDRGPSSTHGRFQVTSAQQAGAFMTLVATGKAAACSDADRIEKAAHATEELEGDLEGK